MEAKRRGGGDFVLEVLPEIASSTASVGRAVAPRAIGALGSYLFLWGSRVCVALWDSQATSRVPFDGSIWPWAISRRYHENSATVAGCAVGLADRHGDLLAKEWRVESSDAALLVRLHPWRCSGGHRHGDTSGRLRATAIYPRFFATLVAESVLGR